MKKRKKYFSEELKQGAVNYYYSSDSEKEIASSKKLRDNGNTLDIFKKTIGIRVNEEILETKCFEPHKRLGGPLHSLYRQRLQISIRGCNQNL